jgi:hypothetical protein
MGAVVFKLEQGRWLRQAAGKPFAMKRYQFYTAREQEAGCGQ